MFAFLLLIFIFILISIFICKLSLTNIGVSKYIFIVVFFIGFLLVLLFYFHFRNFSYLDKYYIKSYKYDNSTFLTRKIISNFSKNISLLKNILFDYNDNYILWWHLSKLYEAQGMYDKSLEFLNIANNFNVYDINLMVDYSLMMAKISNGNISEKNIILINKILNIDSNRIEVLNLLAVDAYKNYKYNVATNYWLSILDILDYDKNNKFIEIIIKKISELN